MIYWFIANLWKNIWNIYVLFFSLYVMHVCLVNLGKCTSCTDRVSFLGSVVTPQGIEVDKAKIEAIESWPQPKTITQVRSFLGLAGFYRCFVRDFSTIAAPLNDLQRKMCLFSGVPHRKKPSRYWKISWHMLLYSNFLVLIRLLSLNVMLVELD